MTWAPTHGCALPSPRRDHAKCGIRPWGPKPSPLFRALEKHPRLFWIYMASSPDGGAEAVADYLLARLEIGVRAHKLKRTMQLVRQCQAWMGGRPGTKTSMVDLVKAAEKQLKEQEKAEQESWGKRRAAIIQRDQERRAGVGNQVKQRVAAAPKPAVVTLQRQRLERSLKATPDMPKPITTTTATTTHSRKPKGECGQRLGRKLDKLIAEIQHEAACESTCCAPVAVLEKPEPSTVDPPTTAAGALQERVLVDPAGTGGSAGFTHSSTAWDCMAGKAELISEVQDFLKELDESPDLRAAATLRSLSRIRGELERIPETAALGDPVELRLQDVLVIARQMLSRLR